MTLEEKYKDHYELCKRRYYEGEKDLEKLYLATILYKTPSGVLNLKKAGEKGFSNWGEYFSYIKKELSKVRSGMKRNELKNVIENLTKLTGIKCSRASTLLHFIQEDIPIIDRFSYKFWKPNRNFKDDIDEYLDYVEWYRSNYPNFPGFKVESHYKANFKIMAEGKMKQETAKAATKAMVLKKANGSK